MSLVTEQPPPTPSDRPASWPIVIARMIARRPHLVRETSENPCGAYDALLADMAARDAEGRRKYGTPLQPHNGRDSLVDLYQELLDGAVYAENALAESPADGRLFRLADDVAALALSARILIHERDGR